MKTCLAHKNKNVVISVSAVLLNMTALPANAFDWTDTSVSWKYGTKYAEPFVRHDISKNIFALTHANGYQYGTNFLNVDYLISDDNNPAKGNVSRGAQEVYVLYRHTLNIGKVLDQKIAFGPVRGVGLTAGFDWNTKDDSYGSRKQMLLIGPTLMLDVPGFFNVSLLARNESQHPNGVQSRYTYDTNLMLNAVWKLPFDAGSVPASFEGYANFIESKGKNEFGGKTAPETNIDMKVMFDVGALLGASKNSMQAGFEYQYWRNKYGVPPEVSGSMASTLMIRTEYHF